MPGPENGATADAPRSNKAEDITQTPSKWPINAEEMARNRVPSVMPPSDEDRQLFAKLPAVQSAFAARVNGLPRHGWACCASVYVRRNERKGQRQLAVKIEECQHAIGHGVCFH